MKKISNESLDEGYKYGNLVTYLLTEKSCLKSKTGRNCTNCPFFQNNHCRLYLLRQEILELMTIQEDINEKEFFNKNLETAVGANEQK